MTNPTLPQLPKQITVRRKAGSDVARVFIDGQEFPWLYDATEPVRVDVQLRRAPSVTLTIMAESVHVEDDMFAGANIVHEHDDEPGEGGEQE